MTAPDIAPIVRGLTEAQRASFIRDTQDPKWEPPMWIRAFDHRLVDYNDGRIIRTPYLTWTPLGLAVRAHLKEQAS